MDLSYIQQCRAVGTGGGGRQILTRIEENSPDSNGLKLQIPHRIFRPSYGLVSLYMPRAMRTFLMSYIWCVCTRIVIHAKSIQVFLWDPFLLPQCKFKTVLWFRTIFIFFYAHFGLKNNNNLMDRSHFEIQDLTTAHSSGCPWNFLNYLCMSPVVTSKKYIALAHIYL